MIHFFDYFHDKLLDEKNQVTVGSGLLLGWVISFYTLFDTPTLSMLFTWEFVLKALFGVIISVITTMSVLVVTDIYKYAKPKVINFAKAKILSIKTKLKNQKNVEKENNERRA